MKSPVPVLLLSFFFVTQVINAGYSDSTKHENKKKPSYKASRPRMNDILHTRLDVSFNWEKSEMDGKANIIAKPYFKATSKLILNARGMEIKSVEVYDLSKSKNTAALTSFNPEIITSNTLNSSYVYVNDSLNINLGREFKASEKYLVKINYTARPNTLKKNGSHAITEDKGLYFINPKGEEKNKMPQIWTQGETEANSGWFPTIDSPNEKMTNEIFMTVDEKYTTLSNGFLVDAKKHPNGTRTDHWKMDLPHAPYLVMMAVGEFKKVTDTPWNGREVSYYVENEYVPYAKSIFGNTKEMIEFFSTVLGTPYPWPKYSQIVVRDYVSGAMENTSATLHGDFMVYQTDREMIDGKKGEDVISHELFHQWFGDYVTAESWSNLPLNESFATYGEYLWQECKNGRDAADAHSHKSREGYFEAAEEKQVDLIRFHYNNHEDMFDAFSYNKGGQVLHMLRKYVGDQAFFASLKLYLEKNKFKSAEIHDLRLAFEEVTGEDLNWFFNQWFLSKGHPVIDINKSYDTVSKTVTIKIKQLQNLKEVPLYILPVDVDVYYNGKKDRHRITITEQQQEFILPCEVYPNLVNFDAERQLLARKTYTKTTDEAIFMYKNAPLLLDRYEALNTMAKATDNNRAYQMLSRAATHDSWWEMRAFALQKLKPWVGTNGPAIKNIAFKMATTDRSTLVKGAATHFLGENYKGRDLDGLYNQLLSERSFEVASNALTAQSNNNPQEAMRKAKMFEKEKNNKIFQAVAKVYTQHGDDENQAWFTKAGENFSGFGYFTYLRFYNNFLKRCNNPASFELAAADYLKIYGSTDALIKEYIKKSFREFIIDQLTEKETELKKNNNNPSAVAAIENTMLKLEAMYKTL